MSIKLPKLWHRSILVTAIVSTLVSTLVSGATLILIAYWTNANEQQKIHLVKIETLHKFHPLIVSDSPRDREFAHSALTELGYGPLADKFSGLSFVPFKVEYYIPNDSKRSIANTFSTEIGKKSTTIHIYDKNQDSPTGQVSIRYFNDTDKAIAENIAYILRKKHTDISFKPEKPIGFLADPGKIEIWLPEGT